MGCFVMEKQGNEKVKTGTSNTKMVSTSYGTFIQIILRFINRVAPEVRKSNEHISVL